MNIEENIFENKNDEDVLKILSNDISHQEQIKLFYIMHNEKYSDDIRKKVRKKLIENNISLVRYLSQNYASIYNIPVREVDSFGYEGLIKAVDNFDETLGNTFVTYALPKIKYTILKEISRQLGFKCQSQIFFQFMSVKKKIELEYDTKMEECPGLVYIIVKKMKEEYGVGDQSTINLINNLLINTLSICKFEENKSNIDFLDGVTIQLDKMFERLTPKQVRVIKMRYGFDGNECATLEQIGNEFGITREGVRLIEKRAFKKINRYVKTKKLDIYW